MKVLVTCPPMLHMMDELTHYFEKKGVDVYCPDVVQTLSENELCDLVPAYDGWIIGDDPATRRVFEAGAEGRLKAAVKWGIGVDNVDFKACEELGIPIANTPMMFGREVADVAMCYMTMLARDIGVINDGVRAGNWPKPRGMSLAEKVVGLVGFGDIGKNVAKRLLAADTKVVAYDPYYEKVAGLEAVTAADWPNKIEQCDFLVFTCALTKRNRHMLGSKEFERVKKGVCIVNVARGPLIDESALCEAMKSQRVRAVALDVFEVEPLSVESPLRDYPTNVFGSHNSSNTSDAVRRASKKSIEKLFEYLDI